MIISQQYIQNQLIYQILREIIPIILLPISIDTLVSDLKKNYHYPIPPKSLRFAVMKIYLFL